MNQEGLKLLLSRHLAPSGDGVPLIPKKERDFFVPQNWSLYIKKIVLFFGVEPILVLKCLKGLPQVRGNETEVGTTS